MEGIRAKETQPTEDYQLLYVPKAEDDVVISVEKRNQDTVGMVMLLGDDLSEMNGRTAECRTILVFYSE